MKKRNLLKTIMRTALGAATLVSPGGLETLAGEITTQPTTRAVSSGKIIVLDPGHGMGNNETGKQDPGKVEGKYKESELALAYSNQIKSRLEQKGYTVFLTREDGATNIALSTRVDLAKSHKAEALVSIHVNSSISDSSGSLTCYNPNGKDGKLFAELVQVSLDNALSKKVNGYTKRKYSLQQRVGKNSLAVLAQTDLPSILIETGFLSNVKDRIYLTSNSDVIAQGIADGIDKYFSQQPASQPTSRPSTQPGGFRTYTIKKGETYWGIGKSLGVSAKSLQDWNPSVKPQSLKLGQEIRYLPSSSK